MLQNCVTLGKRRVFQYEVWQEPNQTNTTWLLIQLLTHRQCRGVIMMPSLCVTMSAAIMLGVVWELYSGLTHKQQATAAIFAWSVSQGAPELRSGSCVKDLTRHNCDRIRQVACLSVNSLCSSEYVLVVWAWKCPV